MQIGECAGQTKIAPEGAIFLIPKEDFGGAIQSRTGLDGFAIRRIGVLPLHQQYRNQEVSLRLGKRCRRSVGQKLDRAEYQFPHISQADGVLPEQFCIRIVGAGVPPSKSNAADPHRTPTPHFPKWVPFRTLALCFAQTT